MPQARRGRSAAAAAAEAQSSSEENTEAEPRPKQGKSSVKKSDKTASAVALEELESLNHEAASIIKKTSTSQSPSSQSCSCCATRLT